jgi:hypothetical protein
VCDTVVVVPESGPVWFAKNSDREPSEAQFLESHDGSAAGSPPEGLPDAPSNVRVTLSRPAWMWGCEMGVNAHGLAIGNEAVFTRVPVPKAGYTGMDFQRIALTRCRTADDASDGAPASFVSLPQLLLDRGCQDGVGVRNRGGPLGREACSRRRDHLERVDDRG